MTAQDTIMDEKSGLNFKTMLAFGLYTVAIAVGAMGGLMALLFVA